MNDFWNNISRYPRFFISSLAGLILVMLAPLKNLFKTSKLRIFSLLTFLAIVVFLYLTIKNMSGS